MPKDGASALESLAATRPPAALLAAALPEPKRMPQKAADQVAPGEPRTLFLAAADTDDV